MNFIKQLDLYLFPFLFEGSKIYNTNYKINNIYIYINKSKISIKRCC